MYTAVIRQRGQITIPDKLREELSWLQVGEVVGLVIEDDEVRVKPKARTGDKAFDYDEFQRRVELARTFEGTRGDLSRAVMEDREKGHSV